MVTKEQFINGVLSYADSEILPCLPTAGKWGMGTIICLASSRMNEIMSELTLHPMVKALGVVDENGNIDSNRLISALSQSAGKYGTLEVTIPIIGRLGFNANDVEKLRNYIGG